MSFEQTSDQRKAVTRSRIYRKIYDSQGASTRQSLAKALGLSLPTIYQHLSSLIEDGLVTYSGQQESTGGRRPSALTVVPDARIAVGISITNSRVRLVATDLCLRELAYRSIHTSLRPDAPEFRAFLAQQLEAFLDVQQLDRSKLLGVGLSVPGVLSPDGAGILLAPTLGLRNTSLAELMNRLPYRTHVANDGSCGGFAEWLLRRGRSAMAYLSLEDGVGGALMTGDAVYTGDNRRSAEFGHMCVAPAGLPCKCGKRGCLEAYCSAARIREELGLTLEEFFAGLEHGNTRCRELWEDLLEHLALGVNNIRMALDCDVVLGGFLSENLTPYFPQLKARAAALNTFEGSAEYLHLSILRRHTAPLGAAFYFIQDFLDTI